MSKRDVDSFEKARRYAFLLLRYRDRSEKEIVSRLRKKGFSADIIDAVKNHLKEYGFIDDVKFAESLKRLAAERKSLGRMGVYRYLTDKGISAELADEISGKDADYESSARAFVIKKMKHYAGLESEVAKRRLWAALARRGYSPEVIRSALGELNEE